MGIGIQKLTKRYASTARIAWLWGTPNPTKVGISTPSITPRPPGVRGMAAKIFARP
jgi:hypothetical protein